MLNPELEKYLKTLEKELRVLPHEERQDGINELKSQLYDCLQAGETAAQIIERLGKPQHYAKPLLQAYLKEVQDEGSIQAHLRIVWKQALIPVLIIMLFFCLLFIGNTFYLFSNLSSHPVILAQIGALSLPAIFVLVSPVSLLWLIPLYIFKLGEGAPLAVLRQPKTWTVSLCLSLSIGVIGAAVQEYVVPSANTALINSIKQEMRRTQPDLQFEDTPTVRNMSAREAYTFLSHKPNNETSQKNLLDYYTKFSLPLMSLVFGLFGLLTAGLMLSGVFHPYYTLLVIGSVLPLFSTYFIYSSVTQDHFSTVSKSTLPLLQAFAPNLLLGGIALLFLVGLLLPQHSSRLKKGY